MIIIFFLCVLCIYSHTILNCCPKFFILILKSCKGYSFQFIENINIVNRNYSISLLKLSSGIQILWWYQTNIIHLKKWTKSLIKSWCVFLQNLGWRWGRGNPLTVMSRVFHRKFIRENCIYHSGISKPGERSPCQTYIFYFITQAIQTCVYMWYSSTFISVILNCSCVSESLVETIESGQVRLCYSDKWSPNIMAYYSKDLVLAHCMYSWRVTHGCAPSCVHYDTRWKSNL